MEIRRRWEHFPHEADVGVRGIGPDPASAFEQAALALTAAVTDPALVEPLERVTFACGAPDLELLLTDWLNAVVREMSARKMLFSRFRVSIDERCLEAQRGAGSPPGGRTADQGRIEGLQLHGEAWGEVADRPRHQPATEPKGATYTALSVRQGGDGAWTAECVVDV